MLLSRILAFMFAGYGLGPFVTGSAIPNQFRSVPVTSTPPISTQVEQELGLLLSNTTTIIGPDNPNFRESVKRWNNYDGPRIQVLIEPGQESDVPKIVRYCNDNNVEFLVYNRGHGMTATLGEFHGIQISMGNLNNIAIQPDGQSAWFQGGAIDGDAVNYLWDRGYVTATGACDCVGLAGAALGGGHGRLEGLYGMVSDNILELDIVLWNGTTIRVNSTSHSNLLWAMKGAGHNFGVVTRFRMNIYPRGPDTWHYKNYFWRAEKLEAVFTALNRLHGNGTTPVNMAVNYGNFLMNTSISAEEPVIFWTFGYRGSAEDAARYLGPFDAIKAVSTSSGDLPYPRISDVQENGLDSAACAKGIVRITATTGLQVYNITAERRILDHFTKRITTHPELARAAFIVHEGYSTEGVTRHHAADTAYPFRGDHHLMQFQGNLGAANSTLEAEMWEWARSVKQIWNAGQPGRLADAYVNYANGFEGPRQWYGHEPWRLERLRALKADYDPYNRFRFFNPIVQS